MWFGQDANGAVLAQIEYFSPPLSTAELGPETRVLQGALRFSESVAGDGGGSYNGCSGVSGGDEYGEDQQVPRV